MNTITQWPYYDDPDSRCAARMVQAASLLMGTDCDTMADEIVQRIVPLFDGISPEESGVRKLGPVIYDPSGILFVTSNAVSYEVPAPPFANETPKDGPTREETLTKERRAKLKKAVKSLSYTPIYGWFTAKQLNAAIDGTKIRVNSIRAAKAIPTVMGLCLAAAKKPGLHAESLLAESLADCLRKIPTDEGSSSAWYDMIWTQRYKSDKTTTQNALLDGQADLGAAACFQWLDKATLAKAMSLLVPNSNTAYLPNDRAAYESIYELRPRRIAWSRAPSVYSRFASSDRKGTTDPISQAIDPLTDDYRKNNAMRCVCADALKAAQQVCDLLRLHSALLLVEDEDLTEILRANKVIDPNLEPPDSLPYMAGRLMARHVQEYECDVAKNITDEQKLAVIQITDGFIDQIEAEDALRWHMHDPAKQEQEKEN